MYNLNSTRDVRNRHSADTQARRKISRAAMIETLETRRLLAVVLKAEFGGAAPGTGAASLVSLGGTGALVSAGNMTASQTADSPFLNPDSGGYLKIVDAGLGTAVAAGVSITPTSSANSLDSWYADGGSSSFDTLNGAFDFFFRSNIPSTSWDGSGVAFRPFDISGGNGGLRVIVNSLSANQLQMELKAVNSAGTTVMDLFARNLSVNFAANTLYHLAGTVSTDAAGKVAIKLFAAPGNVEIDPSSNANLIASAAGAAAMDPAATNGINHAFNSAAGFVLGKTRNTDTLVQTQEFDSFRVYNAVPATFEGLISAPVQPGSYFPDLPNPEHPADNPALLPAFDPFTPPVSIIPPAANAPAIAEYTRTGGPGDSLVLTGDKLTSYAGTDLGKDTAFVAYGQTAGASGLASSTIPAFESDKATITLDNTLPGGSAYMLWARNSKGYSQPVIVNKAEAWWVGPDQATRGQTISLYGKNLSFHGGTTNAWVYIKPASGAGQWATVTAVNPYKVDFVVPNTLANDAYEVWAHNGSGGKYGWSGPVSLTVNNGVTWSANIFNVKNYGATGNGVSNDATAIQNAINAAKNTPFSTVYFPTGAYLINSSLQMYSNLRLDGDGAAQSILKGGTGNFGGQFGSGLVKFGSGGAILSNTAVQELTLDVSGNGNNFTLYGTASNLHVTDVNLKQLSTGDFGASATYLTNPDHLFLKRVNVTSQFITLNARQVFIDSSNFYGRDDRHLFNNQTGMSEFAATNNTGQDYDNSTTTGWASGVWWKFLNGGATAQRGFYFENNTSHDLGIRMTLPDTNWGEQYSWEQDFSKFVAGPVHNSTVTASVVSADATHVTFDAPVPTPGGTNRYVATIINGKGVGQWRTITVYNGATITLDKPWNVVPDAASTISILAGAEKIAIYNNHMDGRLSDAQLPDSAVNNAAGIQPYGGVLDLAADGNTFTELRYGVFERGIAERSVGADSVLFFEPNYFHLYTNNTMQNNRYGIWEDGDTDVSGAVPATYLMGMIYRNTSIQNPIAAGFTVYSPANPSTASRWTNMNVFEKGSIINASTAIALTTGNPTQLGNLVFINNAFDRGSAALSGSKGIVFESAGQLVELQNNQWNGFQSVYNGPNRGAVLAAPTPVIEAAATAGGSAVNRSLLIWNEGTANLPWTASDDAAWLTLGATGGNIAAEDEAQIGLTINPSALAAGTYIANITLTSGTQTRKATVRLVVLPPAPSQAALQINDGSAQRSKVTSLTVTFDQAVTLASDAFTLLRRSGTSNFALSILNPSGDQKNYVISFTGADIISNSLADGVYDLTIKASSVVDAYGQTLTGGDRVYTFHRLFGDANGDRTVTNFDYSQFKKTYGLSTGSPSFNAAFDYDNSGTITNFDYSQFKKRYGLTLSY